MPSLIVLMLLACGPAVVCYLARRYRFPRGVTTHDQHQATNGRGERTLTRVMAGTEGERVIRWMEEGRTVFESVRRILDECDQLKEAAGAAQKECEQLQQHCEELREEVRRLQAETERVQKERAESARWFAAMVKDAASRFRIQHPPA
jgi:chromosome segregation ATPase